MGQRYEEIDHDLEGSFISRADKTGGSRETNKSTRDLVFIFALCT